METRVRERKKFQRQSRDSMFTNTDTLLSIPCFSENFNIAKIEFFCHAQTGYLLSVFLKFRGY